MKLYFRQAWQLLRQNRLFSTIYIVGTGLSIAMTMTLVIMYYVKMAPVYPEQNRSRTLVTKGVSLLMRQEDSQLSSQLSYQMVSDYFYPLTKYGAEAVAAVYANAFDTTVELPDNRGIRKVRTKYVDDGFWQVFTFSFASGKGFTNADFRSGIRTAVISTSMARQLFGEEEAVGRNVVMESEEYRICGVVRDVSLITPATYADVWIPFTVLPQAVEVEEWGKGVLGELHTYVLARDEGAMDSIAGRIRDNFRKLSFSQKEYLVKLHGQPVPYWQSIFYEYSNVRPDWNQLVQTFGTLLLALLFVPAFNLAGMISSRMNRRLGELGIRKAFGASKRVLLTQLLIENLVLTCFGGVVGLLLSYALVYLGRNWLPSLFGRFALVLPAGADTLLTWDMLFNPFVFGITFVVCLLLNILSAVIPALHALKKDIIYSLNHQR